MSERFIKFELVTVPAPRSLNLPAFSIMIDFRNTISIFLILIIFTSIIPYASEYVWTETLIFGVIFALCGICLPGKTAGTPLEYKRLLIPLFLLAAFSFFQGLITLAIIKSNVIYEHFPVYSYDLSASLRGALKIASFAGFIWLLTIVFRTNLKVLVGALIFTGNFFALFGIVRFLLQNYFPAVHSEFVLTQLLPDKGFGTYLNQNHFAYLMLMTLGLNISFLRAAKFENRQALGWLTLSAVNWTALILTGSRGGILSSFAEVAVLILLGSAFEKNTHNKDIRRFKTIGKRAAVIGLSFLFFVLGVVLIGQGRVLQRFEELPSQIEGATSWATFRRIDVWQACAKMIGEHWFSGIGFGGFPVAVAQYINISGHLVPIEAHNDYLEFITAGGIIAAVFGAWFLLRFYKTARVRFNEQNSDFSMTARLAATCGISGVALHSFVDYGLQIEANLLFFAALIYLVVHKNAGQDELSKKENSHPNSVAVFGSVLLLIAAAYSMIFSYASYELVQAKNNLNPEFSESSLLKLAYDADYYAFKSELKEKKGDYSSALNDLQTASDLRPYDYEIQLKLAQLLQSQNQTKLAESAYLQTLKLAPYYAKPYFYYGQFLFENKRPAEGFNALRTAFQRNPNYFDAAAEMAWTKAKGDPLETINLLSPLAPIEREYLAAVFFQKGEFKGFLNLTCREEDLNPPTREKIIRAFFEIKQYVYADLIDKRECNAETPVSRDFADGDFESGNFQKKQGFGWRVGNLPPGVKLFLDGEHAASGRQSLGVYFDGDNENISYILSQTLVAEKNRQYLFSFSYRTNDLKTKNFPILQIVGKNFAKEDTVKIIYLPPQENGWTRVSTVISTNNQFEALEIRLTREACGQDLCPIFGRLWLDDFRLTKKT